MPAGEHNVNNLGPAKRRGSPA